MASQAITTTQVQGAAQKLQLMRRSLVGWLVARDKNVRLGIAPAARGQIEAQLASELHALLAEVMPNAALPTDAVSLAKIAIAGEAPVMQSNPAAMGGIGAYLTWPVLVVGGLLLAVVTAIKTYGDVARDAEEKACIRAGACTDYGFWLKVGGVAMIGYVAHKNGMLNGIKKLLKGRS